MLKVSGYVTLTRDPETKKTQNNVVTRCGAADNILRNGEKVGTVFYELVGWGNMSDELAKFKKGEFVSIEGAFTPQAWTGNDGKERVTYQITLRDIKKYVKDGMEKDEKPAKQNQQANQKAQVPPKQSGIGDFEDIPDDDDELPF